ncbi:MAG: LytTR family DNA-binding domain-containing protein [Prolixibacteraceae bacterium]|nr:LytTR family DNA-binding domain-containing protein [Prolixibacteraceae bacterium]
MIYRCITVDDEPLALDKISGFVEQMPQMKLEAQFGNAREALAHLVKLPADILFLDIQMEQMTGLDLLAALPEKPQVILTTAYSEYALKGYELEVTDYILKPYSFERFARSANLAIKRLEEKTSTPSADFIFVKTDYRLVKIRLNDILYIEGMRDFRCIVTTSGKILTQQTFGSFEEQLPSSAFARIHKSYMISVAKIESIEKHRVKIGSELLPVSESYRESFYKRIGG